MKTIFKLSTIILLLTISNNLFAQHEVISENVSEYDYFSTQKYGVNGTHFFWGYYDIHFYTPSIYGEQINVKYGQTYGFSYGIKYKLQIFNWLATGLDANYNFENYTLKDRFLNTASPSKDVVEKIGMNNLGSEFYLRFFIGKRGNTMGKYLDLGAFGAFNFANNHNIKIKNASPNYYFSQQQKISNKNLAYILNLQYGGVFRLGYNKYAIVAKYRLSDIFSQDFKQTFGFEELPRLSIGFELNIY